jgi:hypothetical protein
VVLCRGRFWCKTGAVSEPRGAAVFARLAPTVRRTDVGCVSLSHDGLEREFKFFRELGGSVCAMCAPRDQRKSSNPKANVDKPVFVPILTGWRALGMRGVEECFVFADLAVLGSVAIWNDNGPPVQTDVA